jgi:HEAT repeat protein
VFREMLMENSDSMMRLDAILALAERGASQDHDLFVAALNDSDEFVRRAAASALRELGDARDSGVFREMLMENSDSMMRLDAILALAERGASQDCS